MNSVGILNTALFVATVASETAVAGGFVVLTMPVGTPLKIAGVAMLVMGIYGMKTIEGSAGDSRGFNNDNKDMLLAKFKSYLTPQAMAFNAAIIGIISACFVTVHGV